ncbi:related to APG1 - essential for autophagocytosis [Melanopsichium pennsylvanicum]|uniref:Serine/threonine-protein kinase ATG1 n=2 Tax=Melanopsichium pennsylvanicum TaxID=63383 RepID=A0AAJ5C8I7_9BASI|nr:related to APG1-essential for autophagocytosis [Melanopsichium pennsylvanicum 4]SNX88050.1 related to APG1 - essential for autophagocytosis [Melanopsichium pennsylvanicum]
MSRSSTGREESRIGDFVVEDEVGKGSFAVVHKGYRLQPREPVAIKIVIRKKLTPKLLDNLEGEIAILKAIRHPNIVELKECLKTEHQIYLVMAFCASGDLSQYIKKRFDIYVRAGLPDPGSLSQTQKPNYPHPTDGGLNETIVRSILTQLAAALEFMRGRDIVHRDIKPQNLLLQPPDAAFLALGNPREIPQMKVADFGFARHLSVNTLAETLCGSPLYMAPEILRFEKYDAKADLWSVGAVLFEMTVGKPPFKAANHVELLKRIERGEDRIKFPDERSAGSLAREATRRQELGEPPLPPPHPVSDDIKTLIRQLLRQRPVGRMSFDEFFASPVIRDFKAFIRPHAQPQAVEEYEDLQRSERSIILPTSGIKDASVTSIDSPAQGSGQQTVIGVAPSSPQPERVPQVDRPGSRQVESLKSPAKQAVDSFKTPRDPPKPARTIPRAFSAKYVTGEPSRQDDTGKRTSPPIARSPSSPGIPDKSLLTNEPDEGVYASNNATASRDSEDSFLGKEYVMIEKRNVEVNALADELASSPQNRMSLVSRRPSRLSRLSSGAVPGSSGASPPTAASTATSSTKPIRIASNTMAAASAGAFALPPGARPSSMPRRTSVSSSGSPSTRLSGQVITAGDAAASTQSSRREGTASSVPKEEVSLLGQKLAGFGLPGTGGGGPSSALAKAISMASLRLFGVPSGVSLRDAAALVRTRAQRRGFLRSTDTYDEVEMNLLNALEDLGQKAFVLSEFADSKLAHFFPDGSHQLSQDLDTSTATTGVSPGRTSVQGSARRVSSISSSSSSALDPVAAEAAEAEALMLYVRSLAFLQRAIGLTRKHIESRSRPGAPAVTSAELNDVVQWLRARFNEVYDKADFARSRCNELPESAQQVDKLIFDKAVEVARAAATDELENNREGSGWDPSHCLLAYETASSMLSSLLDPGEDALSLSEGSILMIDKYVKSITKRLNALQDQFGGGDTGGGGGHAGMSPSSGVDGEGRAGSRTDSPLSNASPAATASQ